MGEFFSFVTGRLLIEPISLKETGFIHELVNTPGWIEFIGDRNVKSAEDAELYIKNIIGSGDKVYLVVKLKESGIPVGIITLIKRVYLDCHDIGFAFLPEFTNMGYAYEAANEVMIHAVNHLHEPYLFATTVPENVLSIKLLKKLGLKFEKEIEVEDEILHLYSAPTNKLLIDHLVKSFFRAFTNKNGRAPSLNLLNGFCIPGTMLICKSGETETIYNLESFIEPRRKILSDGTLREFEEREVEGETKITGGIAQRNSIYSKSGILDGNFFEQTGHKLFQFVNTAGGWKISSVLWEDEPAGVQND